MYLVQAWHFWLYIIINYVKARLAYWLADGIWLYTHTSHIIFKFGLFLSKKTLQKFVMDRLDATIFAVLTTCMPKFKSYSYLQYVCVCINSQVFFVQIVHIIPCIQLKLVTIITILSHSFSLSHTLTFFMYFNHFRPFLCLPYIYPGSNLSILPFCGDTIMILNDLPFACLPHRI